MIVEKMGDLWPGLKLVEASILQCVETGLFYWADETGDLSAEYKTLRDAREALDKYCEWLENSYD